MSKNILKLYGDEMLSCIPSYLSHKCHFKLCSKMLKFEVFLTKMCPIFPTKSKFKCKISQKWVLGPEEGLYICCLEVLG